MKKKITKKTKKTIQEIRFRTQIIALPYFQSMHCLEIPKKVVQAFGGTFKVRLICTINKTLKFQCGLMALGQGRGYIMFTKKRLKVLGLRAGDKIEIHLKRDKSKYGMKICEELQEVLKQDPEGSRRFESLMPGKQRNIIHFVGSTKNSDKRIERALLFIERLKALPEGKESMRALFGGQAV